MTTRISGKKPRAISQKSSSMKKQMPKKYASNQAAARNFDPPVLRGDAESGVARRVRRARRGVVGLEQAGDRLVVPLAGRADDLVARRHGGFLKQPARPRRVAWNLWK